MQPASSAVPTDGDTPIPTGQLESQDDLSESFHLRGRRVVSNLPSPRQPQLLQLYGGGRGSCLQ